jgi:pyrroline-5-carboxylate reductase
MPQFDLALIGGGNMGTALLAGLLDAGAFEASSIAVVEVVAERREQLTESFPGVAVVSDVPTADGAVLAVKPGDALVAAEAIARAGARRLLSIAAGVRLASIEAAIRGAAPATSVAVIRAMPNTPALVRHGASAVAAGTGATEADLDWAAALLRAVGTVERVEEDDLDAFTAVIGSGPAYLFYVAESLIDAAVAEGLERSLAERSVRQLFVGSALLLERDGEPVALRRAVTSPGGTTAAGISALDAGDARAVIAAAVRAATERSRQLG